MCSTMIPQPTHALASWKTDGRPRPKGPLDRLTGRPIQFYRPTRSQAPHYAKAPELRGMIECSICRYLFLSDTTEARREHRAAHVKYTGTTECGQDDCGLLTRVCQDCGEDVCADFRCQRYHVKHFCRWFQQAAKLDGPAADDLLERHIPCRSHSRSTTRSHTMPATAKKSAKRSTRTPASRASRKSAKSTKATTPRPSAVETYGNMTDEQMVKWATARKPWWTTRAGQIEDAGVKNFRTRVHKAMDAAKKAAEAKASKKGGRKAAA